MGIVLEYVETEEGDSAGDALVPKRAQMPTMRARETVFAFRESIRQFLKQTQPISLHWSTDQKQKELLILESMLFGTFQYFRP